MSKGLGEHQGVKVSLDVTEGTSFLGVVSGMSKGSRFALTAGRGLGKESR